MYKLLALLLIAGTFAFKQGPAKKDNIYDDYKVYIDGEWVTAELDSMPKFRTGEKDMQMFLAKNMRYPINAQRAGISGVALITVEITENGKIINQRINDDPGWGLGQEALRVVKLFPDEWTPGVMNGKPVRVQLTIPARFTIK
jgi:periplasmic protein TonB